MKEMTEGADGGGTACERLVFTQPGEIKNCKRHISLTFDVLSPAAEAINSG